jgi:hypothetical protein
MLRVDHTWACGVVVDRLRRFMRDSETFTGFSLASRGSVIVIKHNPSGVAAARKGLATKEKKKCEIQRRNFAPDAMVQATYGSEDELEFIADTDISSDRYPAATYWVKEVAGLLQYFRLIDKLCGKNAHRHSENYRKLRKQWEETREYLREPPVEEGKKPDRLTMQIIRWLDAESTIPIPKKKRLKAKLGPSLWTKPAKAKRLVGNKIGARK